MPSLIKKTKVFDFGREKVRKSAAMVVDEVCWSWQRECVVLRFGWCSLVVWKTEIRCKDLDREELRSRKSN